MKFFLAAILFAAAHFTCGQSVDTPSPPSPSNGSDEGALVAACLLAQARVSNTISKTSCYQLNYDAVYNMTSQLVSSCIGAPVTLRPLNILVAGGAQALLNAVKAVFENAIGVKLNFIYRNYYDIAPELSSILDNKLTTIDGFLYDALQVVPLAMSRGGFGFEDLTPYIMDRGGLNSPLEWLDINVFFREVSAVYDGKIIGIPLLSNIPLLTYRRDLFAKYNLTVPSTWPELVELALRMNGTDFNGDGTPDPSYCMTVERGSFLPYYLLGMLASQVQTQGFRQGVLWDPLTLTPLVNNPAMLNAIKWLRALSGVNQDYSTDSYADFSRCLISATSSNIFKSSWHWPHLRGQIGTAMIPGSSEVLDRTTMKMVPCTFTLCSDTTVDASGRKVPINRAPNFGPTSMTFGINPHVTDPVIKSAMYTAIAYIAGKDQHSSMMAVNPLTPLGPIRNSELDNPSNWTLYYNEADVLSYLAVARATLDHPNRVQDISMVNMVEMRDRLDDAGLAIVYNKDTDEGVMQTLNDAFVRSMNASSFDFEAARHAYWKWLKFMPPSPPSPVPPSPSPPQPPYQPPTMNRLPADNAERLTAGQLSGSIVGPVGLVLAILCLGTWYLYRAAAPKHRTILGKLKHPGVDAETTLLVTDIEGSTNLWEVLPTDVMDEALKLHHDVIRRTCQRYNAYPSATEGDSWIVAFHTSVDSVLAAADIQEALLAAEWPPELLELECCAPVYVGPRVGRHASKENMISHGERPSIRTLKAALSATGKALHLSWKGSGTLDKALEVPGGSRGGSGGAFHRGSQTSGGTETPDRMSGARMFKDAITATSKALNLGLMGAILPDSADWKGIFTVLDQAVTDDVEHKVQADASVAADGGEAISPKHSHELGVLAQSSSANAIGSIYGRRMLMSDSGVGAFENHGRYVAAPSLLSHLERCYCAYDAPGPGRSLVWRGLRVRMGAHSGLHEPLEVSFNRSTGRWQYSGSFLALTKAVQDAAHGGMVLLSGECFRQLTYGESGSKAQGLDELRSRGVILHAGDHDVGEGDEGQVLNLYQLVQHSLALRAMVLRPIRSTVQLSAGFLSAPVGSAAVCYMNCVGISSLLAWNVEVTKASLEIMHDIAGGLLHAYGGYLLDTSETLGLLAAFRLPAASIRWALTTIETLLLADWPHELLGHELGEEVGVSVADPLHRNMHAASYRYVAGPGGLPMVGRTPSGSAGERGVRTETLVTPTVLLRGLRMKCGIDLGRNIRLGTNEISGRIAIFGKCMNRAARITSLTKTGQVWCSSDTWDAAYAAVNHASFTCGAAGGSNASGWTSLDASGTSQQPWGGCGGGASSNTLYDRPTCGERTSALSAATSGGAQSKWPCGNKRVAATDLGPFKLKGIEREMNLLKIEFEAEGAHALALPTVRSGRQDSAGREAAAAAGVDAGGAGGADELDDTYVCDRVSPEGGDIESGGDGGDDARLLAGASAAAAAAAADGSLVDRKSDAAAPPAPPEVLRLPRPASDRPNYQSPHPHHQIWGKASSAAARQGSAPQQPYVVGSHLYPRPSSGRQEGPPSSPSMIDKSMHGASHGMHGTGALSRAQSKQLGMDQPASVVGVTKTPSNRAGSMLTAALAKAGSLAAGAAQHLHGHSAYPTGGANASPGLKPVGRLGSVLGSLATLTRRDGINGVSNSGAGTAQGGGSTRGGSAATFGPSASQRPLPPTILSLLQEVEESKAQQAAPPRGQDPMFHNVPGLLPAVNTVNTRRRSSYALAAVTAALSGAELPAALAAARAPGIHEGGVTSHGGRVLGSSPPGAAAAGPLGRRSRPGPGAAVAAAGELPHRLGSVRWANPLNDGANYVPAQQERAWGAARSLSREAAPEGSAPHVSVQLES